MQRGRGTRGTRLEVEDCLHGCEVEFLQRAALTFCALGEVIIKILAEQVEARRNAEVDRYHVGGRSQLTSDISRWRHDIALGQASSVVDHVNGERIGSGSRHPRDEIAPGYLLR
jgi:hypothetical protein